MFLALREVRRSKARFLLLGGAVGLLVFLILFVQALTGALIRQFIGAIDHQSGQVLVYSEDARKNLEGSRVTPDTVERVAGVRGVAQAGPLGEGTFTVRSGGTTRDATLFGFEPGRPGRPTTVSSGRLPVRDFEGVASAGNESKGFRLGARVHLEGGADTIRIVGLARDANYSVLPTVFTTYDTYVRARRDASPGSRTVVPSAVAVRVGRGTSAATVRDRINRDVVGVEALTRAQAVAESPGVASIGESIGAVVLLCFFVVVVVSGLFFLILTVQKAPALTLLRAVGVRAGTLVRALLLQAAVVVLGGLTVGTLLAWLTLDVSGNGLGARVEATAVLRTGALVLALSLVASFGAARRVLRIDPVRATIPGGVEA
ncbi:MAG: FtsX-like permease family protein [Acidimicrobiia bacterium]